MKPRVASLERRRRGRGQDVNVLQKRTNLPQGSAILRVNFEALVNHSDKIMVELADGVHEFRRREEVLGECLSSQALAVLQLGCDS